MAEKIHTVHSQEEVGDFWQNEVVAKLNEQRMVLLFVGNDIPDELEPVVKFLNEQMQNIDVLAVEVKQQEENMVAERNLDQDVNQRTNHGERRIEAFRQCLCGCGGDTGGRFVPGHDERLAQWLHRAKDETVPDSDPYLTYAALRCELDRTLYCHEYTSGCIIELAKKQARYKRKREQETQG